MLDNRFMEAIDMAAMRSGATDTDSYLADWRRSEPVAVGDDMAVQVEKAKADLESHYSPELIKQMIGNGGRTLS